MRTILAVIVGLGLGAGSAVAHPPLVSSYAVFAEGVPGPEGLAFANDGSLIVGTYDSRLLRFTPDGASTVLATLPAVPAGITVARDGRILAALFGAGSVWSVDPGSGTPTLLASGINSPNFIVQSRSGRILVSSSGAGTIVDVTDGTPVDRASGLMYPNGLAIRGGYLYVAETFGNRVSRLALAADGTLGAPAVYATGISLADGIAFDRRGNLLAVGLDQLYVVPRGATAATILSTDPLLNWPSNIAFGQGRGFRRKDMYLANYGIPLGTGTNVLRLGYNHTGAPLIR
jgi:sugar lactone lactonase YvrE